MTNMRLGKSSTDYAFQSYLVRTREEAINSSQVPPVVVHAFHEKYPTGTFPRWIKLNLNTYACFFLDRIWYKLARFHVDYGWLQTRVFSRSPAEREKAASAVRPFVRGAWKVESVEICRDPSGITSYDVIVEDQEGLKRFRFDAKYNFIARNSIQFREDAMLDHLSAAEEFAKH